MQRDEHARSSTVRSVRTSSGWFTMDFTMYSMDKLLVLRHVRIQHGSRKRGLKDSGLRNRSSSKRIATKVREGNESPAGGGSHGSR